MSDRYCTLTIRHTRIERVRITGPQYDRRKALEYCDRHGYEVVSMRALRIAATIRARFAILAERRLPNNGRTGKESA
jgi:hypothetical protein